MSTTYAFAAIMNSGTDVVCWGWSDRGGDCPSAIFNNVGVGGGGGVVDSIVSTTFAFAAIMNSGTDVVCWGRSGDGGDWRGV